MGVYKGRLEEVMGWVGVVVVCVLVWGGAELKNPKRVMKTIRHHPVPPTCLWLQAHTQTHRHKHTDTHTLCTASTAVESVCQLCEMQRLSPPPLLLLLLFCLLSLFVCFSVLIVFVSYL